MQLKKEGVMAKYNKVTDPFRRLRKKIPPPDYVIEKSPTKKKGRQAIKNKLKKGEYDEDT